MRVPAVQLVIAGLLALSGCDAAPAPAASIRDQEPCGEAVRDYGKNGATVALAGAFSTDFAGLHRAYVRANAPDVFDDPLEWEGIPPFTPATLCFIDFVARGHPWTDRIALAYYVDPDDPSSMTWEVLRYGLPSQIQVVAP